MRAEVSILPLALDGIGYSALGIPLLEQVSLTARPHRRLVILGPNGSGKTLLLRIAHGLLAPSAGCVRWADPARAATRQAMVFQKPVFLRRSARGNLDHALGLARVTRAARARRTALALDRFGLAPLADRPARLLSGGEAQRLAIARAWVLDPEVVFLDEPSSQLDPGATRVVERLIETIGAEGRTVVMTTHDLGQARRLADDIAFLHRGCLLEHGPAATFFADPQTPEARAFLSGDLLW